MNASHVTVGATTASAMAALTTVLTGFHGLDADHAAAWAWLICAGLGGLVTLLIYWSQPRGVTK